MKPRFLGRSKSFTYGEKFLPFGNFHWSKVFHDTEGVEERSKEDGGADKEMTAQTLPRFSEHAHSSMALTKNDSVKLVQRLKEHLTLLKTVFVKRFSRAKPEQSGPNTKEEYKEMDLEFLQQQLQLYGVSVPSGLDMRMTFKWKPRLESIVEFQDLSPKFFRSNALMSSKVNLNHPIKKKYVD